MVVSPGGGQVAPDALLRALTTRKVSVVTDTILKTENAAAAAESRDALAKTLYANLFDWLVAAINRKIPSYGAPWAPHGGRCCGCPHCRGCMRNHGTAANHQQRR